MFKALLVELPGLSVAEGLRFVLLRSDAAAEAGLEGEEVVGFPVELLPVDQGVSGVDGLVAAEVLRVAAEVVLGSVEPADALALGVEVDIRSGLVLGVAVGEGPGVGLGSGLGVGGFS